MLMRNSRFNNAYLMTPVHFCKKQNKTRLFAVEVTVSVKTFWVFLLGTHLVSYSACRSIINCPQIWGGDSPMNSNLVSHLIVFSGKAQWMNRLARKKHKLTWQEKEIFRLCQFQSISFMEYMDKLENYNSSPININSLGLEFTCILRRRSCMKWFGDYSKKTNKIIYFFSH